jgi:hypothetical protein
MVSAWITGLGATNWTLILCPVGCFDPSQQRYTKVKIFLFLIWYFFKKSIPRRLQLEIMRESIWCQFRQLMPIVALFDANLMPIIMPFMQFAENHAYFPQNHDPRTL